MAGAALRCAIAAAIAVAAGCSSSPQAGSAGSGGNSGNHGTGGQSPETGSTGGANQTAPDAAPASDATGPSTADAPSAGAEVAPSDGSPATGDAGGGYSGGGAKPPPMPSAGCGVAAGQLPEGAGTLPSGRRYIIRLPAGYQPGKPFPLTFALHYNDGGIGEFDNAGTRAAFNDWAILVLTQSQTSDWRQAFPADLAYFDALVALVKDKLCVDTGRIFAFGFSGGASFSSLLACKRDFLRAFGACGGIPGYDGYTAADCKPLPAWIDQGARTGMVELWTAKDGCMQQMPGAHPNCTQYVCGIAPVIYCTNGAHAWPSYGNADVAAFFKQF
ncbi:MAG TPA: hypothetical protein VMU50_13205 [Polyangia bacterium]|nr:hypothetical protein [Polyangia bacterium]